MSEPPKVDSLDEEPAPPSWAVVAGGLILLGGALLWFGLLAALNRSTGTGLFTSSASLGLEHAVAALVFVSLVVDAVEVFRAILWAAPPGKAAGGAEDQKYTLPSCKWENLSVPDAINVTNIAAVVISTFSRHEASVEMAPYLLAALLLNVLTISPLFARRDPGSCGRSSESTKFLFSAAHRLAGTYVSGLVFMAASRALGMISKGRVSSSK